MHVIFFRSDGWESWDVEFEPLVRAGMPVLVDDDLLFEDAPGRPRPAVVANQWLRELPTSGALSPNTWEAYARALRDWLVFLAERGVGAFEERDRLRSGLSLYAEYRLSGPLDVRLAEKSWDLHTTVLARFYEWVVAEGFAVATPFTYGSAKRLVHGHLVDVRRNLAKVRQPRRHTTIKYLERDFADLLLAGLEGLLPDGTPDQRFRGHHPGRNSAVVRLVLSSGLRKREFTFLLVPEVPPLPRERTALPVPLAVAAGVAAIRSPRRQLAAVRISGSDKIGSRANPVRHLAALRHHVLLMSQQRYDTRRLLRVRPASDRRPAHGVRRPAHRMAGHPPRSAHWREPAG